MLWKNKKWFCRSKKLVYERGDRRMARLVRADKKAMVTQITTLYNRGAQKTISKHTKH